MNDFSKILNKAKELESNMKESREKIKKITAEEFLEVEMLKLLLMVITKLLR